MQLNRTARRSISAVVATVLSLYIPCRQLAASGPQVVATRVRRQRDVIENRPFVKLHAFMSRWMLEKRKHEHKEVTGLCIEVHVVNLERPQPVDVGAPLSAGGKAPHKGECTAAGIFDAQFFLQPQHRHVTALWGECYAFPEN